MNEQQKLTPAEQRDKIIAGLRLRKDWIVTYGSNLHRTYPHDQIRPDIFETILVPVPLPVAMMLLALASHALVETEKPVEVPNAP